MIIKSFRVYNSKYDGGEYQELALLKTASESLNEYSVQIKSLIVPPSKL